jgi:Transposase DDE domain
LAGTPEFEQSRRERKRIEMLFAHLKRILRLGRLRLRGPSGACDEFLLAATAQNLRKLAKLVPTGSFDPTLACGDADDRTREISRFSQKCVCPTLKLRFNDFFSEIRQ